MIGLVTDPADLGVRDAAAALSGRSLSSRELVEACLARIRERDGTHSFDGDPGSINAWVRVYEEDALDAADRADGVLARAREDTPPLCGIPIGLKDLYAAAGKPLTASSRVLDEVPERDCDAWARLGRTGDGAGRARPHARVRRRRHDRPGRQPVEPRALARRLERRLRGRARRADGPCRDRHGHGRLRCESRLRCAARATVKPTRDAVSIRGIVPLSPTFDNAGPMARTVRDCEPLLAAMAGVVPPSSRRPLERVAVSPRIADLDPDVAAGFERALAVLPVVEVPPPEVSSRRRSLARHDLHRDAGLASQVRRSARPLSALRSAASSSTPRTRT